jgi:hypothetical protein
VSKMKIGHVGLTVEMNNVAELSDGGDTIRIAGRLSAADKDEVRALRDQLVGYVASDDETMVPVIYTSDPSLNGFYVVDKADVRLDNPGAYVTGWWPFTIDLLRPNGFAYTMWESHMTGALLANSHGVATGHPWHAVPATAYWYNYGENSATEETRVSADGSIRWRRVADLYNTICSWAVAPEDYYVGACRLQQRVGNVDEWYTVVGRRPRSNTSTTWRLTNGLVRVTFSAPNGWLGVEHYDGTNWTTLKHYRVQVGAGVDLPRWNALRVVKNCPEEVIIEFNVGGTALSVSNRTVTLSIRRGSYWLYGYCQSQGITGWRIARGSAEVGVAATAGIVASAADADGHKYHLVTSEAHTLDTANGVLIDDTADDLGATWDFGIGIVLSTAAGNTTMDNLMRQYMTTTSERVEPLIR